MQVVLKHCSSCEQLLLKIFQKNEDEGYKCYTDCTSADWRMLGDAELAILWLYSVIRTNLWFM